MIWDEEYFRERLGILSKAFKKSGISLIEDDKIELGIMEELSNNFKKFMEGMTMTKMKDKETKIDNNLWVIDELSYEIYFPTNISGGKGNERIVKFNSNLEVFCNEVELLKRLVEIKEKKISIVGVLEVERRSREYRVKWDG